MFVGEQRLTRFDYLMVMEFICLAKKSDKARVAERLPRRISRKTWEEEVGEAFHERGIDIGRKRELL